MTDVDEINGMFLLIQMMWTTLNVNCDVQQAQSVDTRIVDRNFARLKFELHRTISRLNLPNQHNSTDNVAVRLCL